MMDTTGEDDIIHLIMFLFFLRFFFFIVQVSYKGGYNASDGQGSPVWIASTIPACSTNSRQDTMHASGIKQVPHNMNSRQDTMHTTGIDNNVIPLACNPLYSF